MCQESYVLDKLKAANTTFRELQVRMADPDVAADPNEFMKVSKQAGELEETSRVYEKYMVSSLLFIGAGAPLHILQCSWKLPR